MKKIGIDAGGTLTKLIMTHKGQTTSKIFPTKDMATTFALLGDTLDQAKISVTGGKAHQVQALLGDHVTIVPEFAAMAAGVRALIKEETTKPEGAFILTNVGTGTSIHYMNGEKQERMMGSGVGGGTLLGLSHRLAGTDRYEDVTRRWPEGERGRVDLQVRDIYGESQSPILGRLTASNFGKPSTDEETAEDQLAAVTGMVAETVMLFSIQACQAYQTDDIVYIGSTFTHHQAFRDKINMFTETFGKTPYFLQHGEMSGAWGALLLLEEAF